VAATEVVARETTSADRSRMGESMTRLKLQALK
jgi:hypothetical protein